MRLITKTFTIRLPWLSWAKSKEIAPAQTPEPIDWNRKFATEDDLLNYVQWQIRAGHHQAVMMDFFRQKIAQFHPPYIAPSRPLA